MKLNIDNLDDLEKLRSGKAGESFYISGTLYSARDAAHKKLMEMVEKKENISLSLKNKLIYYMGPSPTRPGNVIGSCGPTSSYRMDNFLEMSLKLGVVGTIGKGDRDNIKELVRKYRAPYLITIGGAAAYLASCIISSEVVMFEELKTESIKKLIVKDFPVIIGNDIYGNEIFNKN